jgi:hypothetical protein
MDQLFKRARQLAKPMLAWLRAWPWFVASIVLGFWIEENFPFSHWPMYSNFSRESGYVYVINAAGKPIAAATLLETAPRLRRQFERERRTELNRVKTGKAVKKTPAEIERDAATHLLKRLAQRLSPDERKSATGLGLVSARLRMDGNRKITVTERTVATIGFEGIPYTPAFGDELLKEAL